MSELSLPVPSLSPFSSCDYSEWSPTWVLIPSVYLLVFVGGSLGNGLVLWAYLDRQTRGHRRIVSCSKSSQTPNLPRCPYPTSRSVTESLIASLALADLAFVMTLPLWAAYTALGYHWPFGRLLCQVSSYIVALNMYASVFSLTGLSVERYCVITRRSGNSSKQNGSTLRARWIVGSVWMAAVILALPALLLRTVREVDLEAGPDDDWHRDGHVLTCFCDMDYSILISSELDPVASEQAELMWSAALGLKSTLFGFLLPLVVLLLCYGLLGRLLSRHFTLGPRPDHMRQRRLLRVIITLVLAFILCWLPFHTNKTLSAMVELGILPFSCSFDQWLVAAHPYAICLGYVNSCLNPLLYACCDPAFRKHCRGLLICVWGKCWGGMEEEDRKQHNKSSPMPSGTHEVTVSKDEQ